MCKSLLSQQALRRRAVVYMRVLGGMRYVTVKSECAVRRRAAILHAVVIP